MMARRSLTAAELRKMSKEAQAILAAVASGRVPALEDLLALKIEDIMQFFLERGISPDVDLVVDRIELALGRDVLALNRGVALDAARQTILRDQTDKAIARASKTIARDVIRQTTQQSLSKADDRPPDEKWRVWIGVGREDGSWCPSCESRHGTIFQSDYWEGREPGDGTTLCEEHCRCRLWPCSAPPREEEGLRREEYR